MNFFVGRPARSCCDVVAARPDSSTSWRAWLPGDRPGHDDVYANDG